MEHDETGCQAPPEGPILCINNCGFFGSVATVNMCSKCYKDAMLKQDQTKFAGSSIGSIVNGSSSAVDTAGTGKKPQIALAEPEMITTPPEATACVSGLEESKSRGPNRCSSCKKRVGLTGFNYCRCGNLFCATHRYSHKHECPFDYHTAAQDAIAKANPVVKAQKLEDKI